MAALMHKLSCRALKLSNNFSINGVLACSKRFLRVEPEEELDRLFIKDSFNDRLANMPKPEAPKMIGRKPNLKDGHSFSTSCTPAQTTKTDTDVAITTDLAAQEDISLEDVYAGYMDESYASHVVPILQHYEVYKHLFNQNVYFFPDPSLNFHIGFGVSEGELIQVANGNRIPPIDTANPPNIQFTGRSDHLYSVLYISLDGHLQNTQGTYLHWYSVNMKCDAGTNSGTQSTYLQAIPLRGTGFHRYVFILLEHMESLKLDILPTINGEDLSSRNFRFEEFYNKLSDKVTPVGIKFFQSEWDDSVRQVFHHIFDSPEPAYEYDYEDQLPKPQVKYGNKEPFQTYLDRYRDRKDIAEEVLKEHLSEITPYKSLEEQTLPYPLAYPTKKGLYPEHLPPTWIKKNQKHKANKTGKYQYIYSESID